MPADRDAFEPVALPGNGQLWTYTVQRFCPKPPFLGAGDDAQFKPYAVGYVELPEIIVEGRLDVEDFSVLKIGMPMRLVVVPFARDADGTLITTYAFRPGTDGE
ncbi:MAG: OB-fold domain-containing protein [Alphaproteobacteria bacterium]|nr:MAG: OB-fold domain-containing protein [Alphaproteobacteria bacterium]